MRNQRLILDSTEEELWPPTYSARGSMLRSAPLAFLLRYLLGSYSLPDL